MPVLLGIIRRWGLCPIAPARLVSHIEVDAGAFRNADPTTRNLR